jgi:oligoendopeptidase F
MPKSAPAKSARKPAAKKTAVVKKPVRKAAPKAAKSPVGKLPEWNLADLYTSITAPEIARDLDKIDADCAAFEAAYKGKLA